MIIQFGPCCTYSTLDSEVPFYRGYHPSISRHDWPNLFLPILCLIIYDFNYRNYYDKLMLSLKIIIVIIMIIIVILVITLDQRLIIDRRGSKILLIDSFISILLNRRMCIFHSFNTNNLLFFSFQMS